MTLHAFAATADLALAIALVAVTVSTLRGGGRPRRVRSWLFFAAASLSLVVRTGLDAFGTSQTADAAALLEVVTLALFTVGFVLLYGADREHYRTIETHAERDSTTGLLNRRAFHEVVVKRLERAGNATSALAVLDLDGFKAVNDSRGHPAGDEVLRMVAAAIRANLRPSDVAARYGGDEFVVFLESCGTPEAQRILQRIRTIVAGVTGSADVSVTASVGIVAIRGGATDLDELIRAADRALIDVKHAGKDHIRVAEGLAR
ncbi:MAG TPA: GGDEF domain-containing protein [Candidatus Limnocylindria bacterium]